MRINQYCCLNQVNRLHAKDEAPLTECTMCECECVSMWKKAKIT